MPAVSAGPRVADSAAVRVVVVDDHHDRRRIMSYVVELGGNDVAVVGHADGPTSAVEAVDRFDANAALIEIQLPTAQGLDTIAALRHDKPALRIIVCSFHNDDTTRRTALSRGADAYLTKPISPRDLYNALRPPELHSSGTVHP